MPSVVNDTISKSIQRIATPLNSAHCRTRSMVGRMLGVWKRRFACLQILLRRKLNTKLTIIIATAVLHNFAANMNEPEWECIYNDRVLNEENDNDLRILQIM